MSDQNQSSKEESIDDINCPLGLTEEEWGDIVLSLMSLATKHRGGDALTPQESAHVDQLTDQVFENLGIIRTTKH